MRQKLLWRMHYPLYALHYAPQDVVVEVIVARPDTTVYSEPSPRLMTDWSPSSVRVVLTQLLRGDFSRAGALADALLADDRLPAVLGTRINGVLGLPLAFDVVNDTPTAATVADELKLDWWEIAEEATLSEWMGYALLVGACAAELVWDTSGQRSIPRLKVWHPSNLRLKDGEWSVQTSANKWLAITPGDGKWTVLTPFGGRRPGTRALLRSVALAWLSKNYALSDWNRAGEVYGSPVRVGKAPQGASDEERRRYRDDLARLAHDSSIVLPEGWDLSLLEGKPGTGEIHENLITWADKAISIAILGQNLTTDVQSGSLAAAEVHERVRADLVQNDAEVLATTSRNEVVTWWAEFNYGLRDLAPWPAWDSAPPADEVAAAEALNTRAQALMSLSTAQLQTGLPIDWLKLATQVGIPLVEGEKLAPPRYPDERFASRGLRLASGDSIDSARGFARGQLYADRLADAATEEGATAVAPGLERVMELVRSAGSYEQLRAALIANFADLDVDDLASLTESSLVLAGLAGRLAVIDDA